MISVASGCPSLIYAQESDSGLVEAEDALKPETDSPDQADDEGDLTESDNLDTEGTETAEQDISFFSGSPAAAANDTSSDDTLDWNYKIDLQWNRTGGQRPTT